MPDTAPDTPPVADFDGREVIIPVRFRLLGPMQMAGLRQGWISAEIPGVGDVNLDSGAGLGSPVLWFIHPGPDGKRMTWSANMGEVFRQLVGELVPDPPTADVPGPPKRPAMRRGVDPDA